MSSNDGLLNRIKKGVQVGLAAVRGTDTPTVASVSKQLTEIAKTGDLDSILWENEAVAKEVLEVKNKLKIFRTSTDLYSFHSNVLRGVISKLDEKHKIYAHGDPQRDFILADYWKHEPILAGAVYSMSAKMSTLTWQLIGTKRLATYFADIYSGMLNMNGAGWGDGISATAQDFYTTDRGAYWITPRYGSHLTGRLTELGVMDSLSCAMTGNWEKPVLYSSYVTGQDLWLRPGEYAHFASMVSPREEFFGQGFCAVSRAYRAARILMGLSDYDWEKLNNLPPEGVAAVSGLTQDEFQDSLALWKAAREKNKNLTYPQVLWLLGNQPNTNVGIDFVGFSQIPESFDRAKVIEQYVNTLALDFGVDSREFWPISTSSLGTAAESEIQHMKAKGKGPGEFIAVIERYLNGEQPEGVEFGFDTQDIGEDIAAASLAKTWIEALLPLYTGGAKDGAPPPNPMKSPGGSAKEPPGTLSVAKQEDEEEPAQPKGDDDKIISKQDLLRLLVDRKVLPNWIVADKRVLMTDLGIAEKELADFDGDQPIKIRWRATNSGGKFEYERLPTYEIQSESVVNLPKAYSLPVAQQNSIERGFSASNGSLDLISRLKQAADELVEQGLERNIHGSPLPVGESLRGPRVTRTALQNELDKWRKHPVLQQYVPTLEESDEIKAILEKV